MTEVQFSSELFMAPEMMYCSLELPSMIEECTKELPDPILKECFSNILLTGMYIMRFQRQISTFLEYFWAQGPLINSFYYILAACQYNLLIKGRPIIPNSKKNILLEK